jgi:hypothetical protein
MILSYIAGAIALTSLAVLGLSLLQLHRTKRYLQKVHASVEAANDAAPAWDRGALFPAVWNVIEASDRRLLLCDHHLSIRDLGDPGWMLKGCPLEPAPAGSQCVHCLADFYTGAPACQ